MATPTNLPAAQTTGNVLTAAYVNDLRGAFRVLQVVSTSDTTSRTTTSDYPQVSTLNVTITPQSTSSKIFIFATISTGATGGSGQNPNKISLYGLSYGSGSTTSIFRTRMSALFGSTAADIFNTQSMSLLHEPATTSACIYNVLFGRYPSFINDVNINPDAGGGQQGRSTITAFEISL
jgi:hypothetical protein